MQYYVVGDEKFSSIDSSGWSETYVDMRQIDRRKSNLISFIREPPPLPKHERLQVRKAQSGIGVILS